MILRGKVDGSAIDSTVLEMEQSLHPEIASQIRVIDSFGPSPIPPWVAGQNVSAETQSALQRLLSQMHENPDGRRILQQAHMARFVSVSDRDYDPIRHMDRVASGA
jgi:phosphonate transport system substrate-binding protein